MDANLVVSIDKFLPVRQLIIHLKTIHTLDEYSIKSVATRTSDPLIYLLFQNVTSNVIEQDDKHGSTAVGGNPAERK